MRKFASLKYSLFWQLLFISCLVKRFANTRVVWKVIPVSAYSERPVVLHMFIPSQSLSLLCLISLCEVTLRSLPFHTDSVHAWNLKKNSEFRCVGSEICNHCKGWYLHAINMRSYKVYCQINEKYSDVMDDLSVRGWCCNFNEVTENVLDK